MKSTANVKDNILEVSQALIQLNGYNGFSYRDIAEAVGVKTSSVHYHFPTKEDLAIGVVEGHLQDILTALDAIMANSRRSSKTKLNDFTDAIFNATYFNGNRMCLAGMLAAELTTLSERIQASLRHFFTALERWLIALLKEGVSNKQFELQASPQHVAQTILSLVEGGLLLSRLYGDDERARRIKLTIQAMV